MIWGDIVIQSAGCGLRFEMKSGDGGWGTLIAGRTVHLWQWKYLLAWESALPCKFWCLQEKKDVAQKFAGHKHSRFCILPSMQGQFGLYATQTCWKMVEKVQIYVT